MKRILMMVAAATMLLMTTAAGWGVDEYSAPSGMIQSLEHAMGHGFDAWSVYAGIGYPGAYTRSAAGHIRGGDRVFLNITSNYYSGGHKRPICWPTIAGGRYDRDLATWAHDIVSVGHQSQLTVTFEHEPLVTNNPNQPKCRGDGGPQYRAAFHHVYQYLRGHGVTARFAFVSTVSTFATSQIESYVPWGDFQVVGADVYFRADAWKSATDKLASLHGWINRHAQAHTMAVVIPELGVDSRHAGAAQMITDATRALKLFGSKLLFVNWNVKHPYGPQTVSTKAAWLQAERNW